MAFYLLCGRSADAPSGVAISEALKDRARTAGLSVTDLSDTTWLAVAGPGLPSTRQIGPWLLVGEVHTRHRPAVRLVPDDDPHSYETKMLARFWGRYIGVRLSSRGEIGALLRDVSGALDCIWWRAGPLTLVASDLPDWLVRSTGRGWRINPDRVEAALHDPYSSAGDLLLDGPVAVLPGTLQDLSDPEPVTLWRPDRVYRSASSLTDDAAAKSLRDAVDETILGFVKTGGALAAEISGGLDSGIVAAALSQSAPDQVRLWLNAWGPDATADERPWVALLAAHLGIEATCVPRATGALTFDRLCDLSLGVRPGLAALDGLHDADWARRFRAAGIDTVLTGKGGDSIFIQPADPGIFVDHHHETGWRALLDPSLPALARWNERSVWTLVQAALKPGVQPSPVDDPNPLLRARRRADHPRHPWLQGIDDLGPAKRRQILGLVQGCGLHTPSLQSRAVCVQHPLLAQPVIEACLALPVWQLTLGRRDRALARQAFANRLPEALVARRSKGEMTAFYGRLIADGLEVLRPWLLHGRLADMGLIDPERADAALTRESLAWKGGYVDIMTTAAIEAWVRAWERRLSGT